MKDPHKTLIRDYEALLQFLYLAPVGIAQIDAQGRPLLLNPRCIQTLLPLSASEGLDNMFDALAPFIPDLREACEAFPHDRGTVIDARRIQIFPWLEIDTLVSCIKVSEARFAIVLRDAPRCGPTQRLSSRDRILDFDHLLERLDYLIEEARERCMPLLQIRIEVTSDELAEQLRSRLLQHLRKDDLIAFWNESSFAISLHDVPEAVRDAILDRVLEGITAPLHIGTAMLSPEHSCSEDLLDAAERALTQR